MKRFKTILLISLSFNSFTQGFNEDKTALTNFVIRMYKAKPFEGVKIIDDYDHSYLLSVLSLETKKYTSETIMTRVAEVKSQSQANRFFNGSIIEMDMIIKTNETKNTDGTSESTVNMIEKIKENSMGFVQGMEQMANFQINNGERTLFIYYRKMTIEE